ncbi:hypothetical protein BMF94_5825 [Rhodotorula taiwanensis]|uniref:PH domain-containing protein n=1 Tax=Rhodotorula taiwanensis TaxID=741276 RepID=A0A2S5B403_9BASI|nr:hypothetical protein BMF94_5825 [Rhodotorula taiwanensis]
MAAVAPAPPATPPRSASGSLRTTPAFSPRSPAAASDASASSRPSSAIIYGVQGAEGGVEAITARRRNSGSFKHMATGGLVSKSPFTQHKSGSTPASPTKTTSGTAIPVANGLYRRTSGSSRRASTEIDGAVKENSWPSDLSEVANGPAPPAGSYKSPNSKTRAFFSSSPFKPVPSSGSQTAGTTTTLSTRSTPSSSPFKPTRPVSTHVREDSSNGAEEPRRQTSSFAALRKNNLVSSSPFVADKQQASAPSPDLPQVPYEIGALTHESAPMDFHQQEFDDAPASTTAQHLANARARAAQVEAHGWNGPSAQGGNVSPTRLYSSSADSVKSALTSARRGMRGPRPLGGTASSSPDDGDETEREDLPRVIRRQPSSKSVAWAETEEVFEFEVESERRHSLMSEISTDDGRYYNSSSDEEDATHHTDSEHSGHEEEHDGTGFSWSLQQINAARPVRGAQEEEDDDDHNSDAEASVISTASSAMDEIVGQIDEYLHEESLDDTHIFSPSQIPSSFEDQPDIPSHHDTSGYSSPQIPQGPQSAFSVSSVSAADDTASEVLSTSSYGGESEEEARVTVAQKAVFSVSSAPPIALPPLPPRTELPSRPADELPAVTALPSVSALAHSDSQFSLPDIPGTSPFLGFEDDGKADSVVTLSADTRPLILPPTRPLQPQSPAGSLTQARAVAQQQQGSLRFVPSPIMASVHRMAERGLASPINLDASPALSRKASLVGSDVTTSSISWYGSTASGSLRGGTVRLGRDRLEERMKAHQALFGPGPDSPVASFGAFPTPSSPAGSSSTEASRSTAPTSVGDHAEHASKAIPNRAIEARPAPKARSATLSSTMLPTIAASPQRATLDVSIGSPLTSRVAEEMQSPLERLQRGMQDREGEHEWRSGDSLLGHANANADVSGDDLAPLTNAFDRVRGPARRRSRSTGDADVAETSSILTLDVQPTMPELGFEASAADEGFGSSVLQSLDDIYNSRNRSYRVRESKQVVVVSDMNGSRAGDVDPGKAWRRKRPSDVHAINRSLSTMSIAAPSARKAKELSGQLFLLLREVNFEGMPLPRQPVKLTAVLDNGRQRVDVAVRDLSAKVALKKEFELVCSADLMFAIHFTVPRPSAASTPVLPQSPPAVSTPPSSPTKAQRALRLFSSPKKKATPTKSASPAPPPTPDPFWDYVSTDGELATSRVVFATEASNCRLKKSRLLVPFGAKDSSSPRSCSGSLVIDMLFVPAVSGVPKAQLPKSMDEVLAGLEVLDTATTVAFESPLTQLGGDTTVWRRRIVKLRGGMLVPYSEVTKRSHVEIDLSLVSHVADLNAASPAGKASFDDDEEDLACMDNSFRLLFKDGNRIDFYADSPGDKARWLEVLGKTIAAEGGVRVAPAWSIAVRKLPTPKA